MGKGKMKNIIRKILKEDDWDWAREITEHTPFRDLKSGDRLDVVEMDEELVTKAILECGYGSYGTSEITLSDFDGSFVIDKDRMEIYETLCNCTEWYDGNCDEMVDMVHLSLGDNKTFWVTEDMMKLHITN
jgi:hypothetical protein